MSTHDDEPLGQGMQPGQLCPPSGDSVIGVLLITDILGNTHYWFSLPNVGVTVPNGARVARYYTLRIGQSLTLRLGRPAAVSQVILKNLDGHAVEIREPAKIQRHANLSRWPLLQTLVASLAGNGVDSEIIVPYEPTDGLDG